MNNGNYVRKQIDINDILLNTENPRFEKVGSEEEALEIMIREYEEKIYNLAKHITENGMNPTELSAVIKSNNKYIVLDGNRRLTALKILNNPDLLNQDFEKLKSKIMKLDKANIPNTINAIEFESEEEANLWIKLKHTGENDGIGTVEWTALQQSRFDGDKYPLSIQLLKYMEKANLIDEKISKNIKDLKITNLERLLGDPDVRNVLSITRTRNELYFPAPNEDIGNILNNLLLELLSEDFTVNDIRNKSDRTKFMDRFKKKYNLTEEHIEDLQSRETITVKEYEASKVEVNDTDSIEECEQEENSEENIMSDNPIPRPKVPEMPSTQDRTTLIPKDFNLTISNTKINDIYQELKEVSVIDYPNVVGASFRVFLELSVDYYIDENNDEIEIKPNDKLKNKLEKAKKHMADKLGLDSNELKDINRAIGSNDNIVSIDILHGYIHSTVAQASADGLKTTWNNYKRFFELLYKVLNDLHLAKA